MTAPSILLVEDEQDLRWVLRLLFEDAGFVVHEAADGAKGLRAAAQIHPDVVLSDVRMPHITGLELLRGLHKASPELPVILLSAVADLATAVGAMKEGAFDYQAKPFDPERLLLSVQRAVEQHALRREVKLLRSAQPSKINFGDSEQARELERTIELVAGQPSLSVLIVGESGTGKEIVAREIHRRARGPAGPFIALDCGALPEPLIESQLFGHRRGAFTGADRDCPGLFQAANGGTLFLDELGNLPLALQQKLLRALQERAVVPVGGSAPVPFSARLLCATNASLEDEMRTGRFRMDLYHRIAEFTLRLPPLSERPTDILPFAHRFLIEANAELGRQVRTIAANAAMALQQHQWQGNLRELRNVIRRGVLLCTEHELGAEHLSLSADPSAPKNPATTASPADLPLAEQLQQASAALEAELLRRALQDAHGNKAAAARALQIDYTTLHRKLKRHGFEH